jgi:four helix bundle protein
MGVHRFEELEVFQRAYKVSLEIHRFSQTMPKFEQFDLASQIRRASKSICANVAEGFGKQSYSKAEFKRFIQMSIGSADEMRVWLRYCLFRSQVTGNR